MAHIFRFFLPPDVAAAPDAQVTLAAVDAKRLHKVLRLEAGEVVEVADGTGRVFMATVEDSKRGALLLGKECAPQPELAPIRVLLAQSGPRADDAIEKLVELGVSAIGPLLAVGRRREARTDRWERIAAGAAAQAKLSKIPMILDSVALADALHAGTVLLSHEEADSALDTALAGAGLPVTLLIGPESGFAATELALARAAGVPIVSLGPTVLRTETAAIVAAAVVLDRIRQS